jgi:mono/diheme cytochrome c family protein
MASTRFAPVALVALLVSASSVCAGEPIFLDQGWSPSNREEYYFLPQGSELMPYSWFLAIEEPWNEKPFRTDSHMASFRYLPAPKSKSNPDGLPVGFTKGTDRTGKDWFGLSCAACHTGELTYRGKAVRVDGGTPLADIMKFQSELVNALKATLAQKTKFERFATGVLGVQYTNEQAKKLEAELREHLRTMADWEAVNRPAHPSGHGVWDALGILLNTINGTAPGVPENYRVPHTPVSYPSIWDTNRHDKLLWNASVENVTLRQVGEVIIVFGRASATADKAGRFTFDSSADLKALNKVYEYTMRLTAPGWPEDVFGKIDRDLAKRGEAVYRAQKCVDCHPLTPYPTVQANDKGPKFIKIAATPISEVGTDPLYAEYFVKRTAVPGPLAPMFKGTMFEGQKELPAAILFLATLTQITEAGLNRTAGNDPAVRQKLLGAKPLPQLPRTPAEMDQLVKSLLVYKASPLAGIWSTAPYLHNGSVSSLYELLLPAAQRKPKFYLGDREFDPKHVGYRPDPSDGSFLYDTSLPGQSNRGHEYGTTISEEDRLALLEFLKTL